MSSPRIWSRFSCKNPDGTVLNFRIQELPFNRRKEAAEFELSFGTPEENLQKHLGISKCQIAMADMLQIKLDTMEDPATNTLICCLDDGTDIVGDIIGLSIMVIKTKDYQDPVVETKSESVKKFIDIVSTLNRLTDVKQKYGLNRYFYDKCVTVHPKYRGRGIATQLLKARRLVCKEHGIPIAVAWMTAKGTQIAGERDGWETAFQIPYHEIGSMFGITFTDTPEYCKQMLAKVD